MIEEIIEPSELVAESMPLTEPFSKREVVTDVQREIGTNYGENLEYDLLSRLVDPFIREYEKQRIRIERSKR